jgi:hypothetical protein
LNDSEDRLRQYGDVLNQGGHLEIYGVVHGEVISEGGETLTHPNAQIYPMQYPTSHALRQATKIDIEKLLINGVEFKPYYYTEEYDKEALRIHARIRFTGEEVSPLHEQMHIRGPVSVIRHGVSDEPREMIFGVPMWSQNDDVIKYEIVLTDSSFFDNQGPLDVISSLVETQRTAELTKESVEELFSILVRGGVLNTTDVASIKESASERRWQHKLKENKVPDLDEWSDQNET